MRQDIYRITIATATLICLASGVLAVEDGQGTNVVRNLRVTSGGGIDLNGQKVSIWDDLGDYIGDMGDESAARIAADASLSNRVNTLSGNLTTASNALNTAIGNESAARQSADSTLQDNINAASNALSDTISMENSARVSADNALSNSVNTLSGNLTTASNALNTAIGNESAARQSADSTLQDNINAASNTLHSSISDLQNAKYTSVLKTITSATDQIPSGSAIVIVTNTTGVAVNLAGNDGKPISIGAAGQFLTVQCSSATPIVLTNSASGLLLEGGVSFTMKENDVIQLICDGTKWTEVHRADN